MRNEQENRETLRERIARVFVEALSLNIEPASLLRQDTALDRLFGMDSLAVLEVLAALEKEFGITVEPDRMEMSLFTDLSRLADYVAARLADKPSDEARPSAQRDLGEKGERP